jgi:hypothetical protein
MTRGLQLRARVFRDQGVFVAECADLGWTTHGATLDEVLQDVPRMVRDYFTGYRQIGRLEHQLTRLGVAGPVPETLSVDVEIDLKEVVQSLRAEQHVDVSLAAVVAAVTGWRCARRPRGCARRTA